MNIFKGNEIDLNEVIQYFNEHEELMIELTSHSKAEHNMMINVLHRCLDELGKVEIYDYLSYCIKELMENAIRANMKRAFFEMNQIDINDKAQYQTNMINFKKMLLEKNSELFDNSSQRGYYVKIFYKIEEDILSISIYNNCLIIDEELIRAMSNLEKAKAFNSIDEAFTSIYNNSEGAGLGIIIIILMLRKMGLNRKNFNIYKTKTETIARLMVPLSLITVQHNQIISNLVINELNDLPQFPEHLKKLQELINNPEVSIDKIYELVSIDTSLVAEIIKFSNTALFMTPKKVSSIKDAIQIIGLKRLKSLIYSYGSFSILKNKYKINQFQQILDHSNKVSYYAYQLARTYLTRELLEIAYLSGLLHDIGKIFLLGINPDLINKINQLCQEKNIPVRIIEELSSGYNHSMTGMEIAKKWNFPEYFIYSIEYHNNPLLCHDEKYKRLIYCIHIANMITKYEDLPSLFEAIEEQVLNEFKILTFSQFEKYINQLKKNYEKNAPRFF